MVLRRASAGDEAAWKELVERYGRLLRAVAGRMRTRDCDAEDAAQITWMALRENIDTIRNPEVVGAWLCQVMRRECLRMIRRQNQELLDEWIEHRNVADREPQPADALVSAELAEALWAAVDRLPAREQQVVRALFDGSDRSYAEIARNLAMPIGSIGPVRMRAVTRLATMLAAEGISAADLPVAC